MNRPAVDYTLVVTEPDAIGRITITSPEVPGLLIWALAQDAFADVQNSVLLLRHLNSRAPHNGRESQ